MARNSRATRGGKFGDSYEFGIPRDYVQNVDYCFITI